MHCKEMSVARFVTALLVTGCTCDPDQRIVGRPISTVNQILDDTSFVRRFGRFPTVKDDPRIRVQTHLAYVEALLRVRTVELKLRAARTRALNVLHDYWVAGEFPEGEATVGMLPTFIDNRGVRCAVAAIVEDTAGTGVIRAIDRRYHNAWIAQIDAPALAAWADASGFTRDELAMIQPSYPPRPTHPDIDFKLTADYRYKIADDNQYQAHVGEHGGDELTQALLVGGALRLNRDHNYWIGGAILGLDGSIGTVDSGKLAYSAFLRLGTKMRVYPFDNGGAHKIGVLVGLGIDRRGAQIERAWTMPLDVFWYCRAGSRTRIGIVGGPRFTVGGADRKLGWYAGVDIVRRDVVRSTSWFGPRDVNVNLGVERMADTTFAVMTLGISSRDREGTYVGL